MKCVERPAGVALGGVERDGDKVRLCYCYEGGIVPTEFKTKAGEKHCWILMLFIVTAPEHQNCVKRLPNTRV